MPAEDAMKRIRRASDTEQWVRSRDTSEVVDALLQLEDEVEKLQGHFEGCKWAFSEIVRVHAGLQYEQSIEDRMNRMGSIARIVLVEMEG